MDKKKNKRSVLEHCNHITGYSIEIGNTTFQKTLEERIQAARAASSQAKQAQKQSSIRANLISTNNNNNNLLHLQKKNKPSTFKINVGSKANIFSSSNCTETQSTSSNTISKPNTSCAFISACKGGPMQRRLEAIKSKKLTNTNTSKSDNALESTKYSNNFSNQFDMIMKNDASKQCYINVNKCNEYNKKYPSSNILPNTLPGHCDRTTINVSNTSNCTNKATSVQSRLIKAKEDLKAKSILMTDQNNVSKTGTVKKQLTCASVGNVYPDKKAPILNNKTKTKRLNQKKTPLPIIPTHKKNNLNVTKVIDNQISIKQKKILLNNTPSETVVLKKIDDPKQNELLNSFSFVSPHQSLKNITKPDDDSMEWEDINEPDNIVNKVNDLRKQNHDYEPMEWTPDSIMHSDNINHCLVVDTNIFLTNLKSIIVAIDQYFPDYGFLTIVLPWQVLQELDCMKRKENDLGFRAREATRWLLEILSQNHPRLKGQPMTKKNKSGPDDAILNCAIILKDRVNIVNLVTDDKILSIKSEVNGIHVRNSNWLQNLVKVNGQNECLTFREAVNNYPFMEHNLIKKFEPYLEQIIVRILKFAVVRNDDYSHFTKDEWWNIYSLIQPFNLVRCLLKLEEHWNLITDDPYLHVPKDEIDWLAFFFAELDQISPETILNWNDMCSFFKYCTAILNSLPYEYNHITDTILNDLVNARKSLKKKYQCTIVEHDESLSTSLIHLYISNNNMTSNVNNILFDILKEADRFCLYVYNIYGFNRIISEDKINFIHSTKLYHYQLIEDYCNKLSNLTKVMLNLIKLKPEEIKKSHIIIEEFSKAIIAFDDTVELDKESLINYCLMKNKKSFLKIVIFFQNNLAAIKNVWTTSKLL